MPNRLTEARHSAGLSIRQLATACGVQPSQISRIETDAAHLRRAGAGLVYTAASTLGAALDWLLELDEQKSVLSGTNLLLRLCGAGCSLAQIASVMDAQPAVVCAELRDAGVSAAEIRALRHDAMAEAWAAGCHDAEIARRAGTGASSVASWRAATSRAAHPTPNRAASNHAWDRAAAQRLYDNGLTDEKIAAGVGVHKTTIVNWRDEMGLPANGARRSWAAALDAEREADLKRLYDQGLSDPRIAEQASVPVQAVRAWRRKYDLPAPSRIPMDEAEAYRLYQEGASDSAIAEKIDCSPCRVRRWRRSRNLPAHVRSNFDGGAVQQLWEQGATDQEIVEQLGLTKRQVWNWRMHHKREKNTKNG